MTHYILEIFGMPISILLISITSQSSGEIPNFFKKTVVMVLVIFPSDERPASSTDVLQISSVDIEG